MVPKGRDSCWYVLTGAPGVGKTTTLAALQAQGIRTVPEAARSLLEKSVSAGRDADAARSDERDFQDQVLELKLQVESSCDSRQLTVFDRGIPDTLAYYRLHGWEPSQRLVEAAAESTYAGAFVFEQLPAIPPDPLRTESLAQRDRLAQLLAAVYQESGIPIVRVPPASLEQRVELLLEWLRRWDQ